MLGIRKFRGTAIDLFQGDITEFACDAMVNAANAALSGGGGVDGAIHRAGGPTILAECQRLGGCATGSAVITGAGDLPCRNVIHAVGPQWQGGNHGEAAQLSGAYHKCLELAAARGFRHLAYAAISTGVYGYPLPDAAAVAMTAVRDGLVAMPDTSLKRITFVLFNAELYRHFQNQLFAIFDE